MGCAPSNEVHESPLRKGTIRRGSIFKREKVSLKIGKNVALTKTFPHLIFVFGGPGSGKGKLLSDAAETFGLTLLNMESILIDSLHKLLEDEEEFDPFKRSAAIQKLVRAQPELLRVDYVLKQLTKKLNSMDKNKCYIVDFMPNLKYILLSSVFIKECSNELRNFENNYAVSFAVHLSIPPDKFQKKKQTECAQVQGKNTTPEANKQSDEADTSRTSKRALLFHNSLKHFLDYFVKHDKLVSLDVSSGDTDVIWERMCEVFDDVTLSHQKNTNTVVLFVFGDDELEDMQIGRFEIEHVSLCDIVDYPKDAPEKLLQCLCKHIDKTHPTQRAFAVDLSETSITKDLTSEEKTKSIMFYDIENSRLEQHLTQKRETKDKPVRVQSVSSLENEVYLFQPKTPSKFCMWMAEEMKKCHI